MRRTAGSLKNTNYFLILHRRGTNGRNSRTAQLVSEPPKTTTTAVQDAGPARHAHKCILKASDPIPSRIGVHINDCTCKQGYNLCPGQFANCLYLQICGAVSVGTDASRCRRARGRPTGLMHGLSPDGVMEPSLLVAAPLRGRTDPDRRGNGAAQAGKNWGTALFGRLEGIDGKCREMTDGRDDLITGTECR